MTKKTCYRTYTKGGRTVTEKFELWSLDADEAVRAHPEEWSFTPPARKALEGASSS